MNIYEILKNKPKGTKLWSPLCGKCTLEETAIFSLGAIKVKSESGRTVSFFDDGKFDEYGEVLLFPSKTISDWNVLKWKKGDVLIGELSNEAFVFSKWNNDEYTSFTATDYERRDCVYEDCNTLGFELSKELNSPKERLIPGQRVIVRNSSKHVWALNFFSHYLNNLPICTGNTSYAYTLPYKGNEELLGTTKKYANKNI